MSGLLPIEIVGGGLAGLAAGLALRRAGVPVTLFEAGGYPRHRVCGEFIAGLDPRTAEQLGIGDVLSGALPHRTVAYHLRGRRLASLPLPATAWGISRHTLDARLAAAFARAGGDLRVHTRAPEAGAPPGRVFAAGRKRSGPLWVGLKTHVRGMDLAADLEIHMGDRSYVGLSRVETGEVNVCGIFFRREVQARGPALLAAYLEASGLASLARRIGDGQSDPSSFCVTAAALGDRRVAPAGTVRIGDACASIPPFTGNGLAMALQSAALAVAPLGAYSRGEAPWAECARAVARAQASRFDRRLLVSSLLHPFLLERRRQSWFAGLIGRNLLPFRAFYAAVH
jgi:2-polyprenyl-6-methoxyphenol hydroxylase-like FAD-dependent oxidoreductase